LVETDSGRIKIGNGIRSNISAEIEKNENIIYISSNPYSTHTEKEASIASNNTLELNTFDTFNHTTLEFIAPTAELQEITEFIPSVIKNEQKINLPNIKLYGNSVNGIDYKDSI
jgi:hypothetical protein